MHAIPVILISGAEFEAIPVFPEQLSERSEFCEGTRDSLNLCTYYNTSAK